MFLALLYFSWCFLNYFIVLLLMLTFFYVALVSDFLFLDMRFEGLENIF